MKIVIFAGGTGTRFWPLSRKKFPKQFRKMFDGKSTLQLMVERLRSHYYSIDDIYISTNENYVSLVKQQIPYISTSNIFTEPEKRNVGPAVGYSFTRLKKQGYKGPVAIVWADHLIDHPKKFIKALQKGAEFVTVTPRKLVFIAEEPRYAENNLGWIHVGENLFDSVYKFKGWRYKPKLKECQTMFASGTWKWNPGYFIVDLENTLKLYKKYNPKMYKIFTLIGNALGTTKEASTIKKHYPKLKTIHFDRAIAEKVSSSDAVVICTDMGWADPGTLYALKEALVKEKDKNLTQGKTYAMDTKDSVMINEDKEKLLSVIGLDGMVVVNTSDALLVVHKDRVLDVTQLIKTLEEEKDLKKYT